MQPCSSPSIGQLAGALAKAQVELTNPPKSLTAILDAGSRRGEGQTYCYAPLSSGLDIIRRALGQQEIAVLQTTALEEPRGGQVSGMVVLTTTLAHSSGEWIATTWPVCRLGDVSDPKLMGAALTYARRYSLFALVGIAGDDDLDAPELNRADAPRDRLARGKTPFSSVPSPPGVRHRSHVNPPLSRVRGRVTRPDHAQGSSPSVAASSEAAVAPPAASDLLASLDGVQDQMDLLRWAKDVVQIRLGLNEATKAALDDAFVRRARAIAADPELLSAFKLSHEAGEPEPLSQVTITPPLPGGHDAQAAV